jgi:deoxyadenosine/deoxycytidine kinase
VKENAPGAVLPLDRLRYVTVEGCIGVGKTTLTHLLSEALSARTVLEVVEENPFLPDFYKDKTAHAFKTQMFFLLSRFKQQESLLQTDLFSNTVVSDYLFDKDRIFAELTLAHRSSRSTTPSFARCPRRSAARISSCTCMRPWT